MNPVIFIFPWFELFNWNLSDSKSTQVSRTFLGILADFNSTMVWKMFVISQMPSSPNLFSTIFGISWRMKSLFQVLSLEPSVLRLQSWAFNLELLILSLQSWAFNLELSEIPRERNHKVLDLDSHFRFYEVFIPADGLSLESEWAQVSSGL